jgi:hypothetical protein
VLVASIRQHTPTAGLEVVYGLPPLELYIQYLASSTYVRLNLKPTGWGGKTSVNSDTLIGFVQFYVTSHTTTFSIDALNFTGTTNSPHI